jgi:hypothetical protein
MFPPEVPFTKDELCKSDSAKADLTTEIIENIIKILSNETSKNFR